MARQLVENLSASWDPVKYTDEYRDNLMRVIQGKLKGRKPKLQARETPQGAAVVDLMSRLKASLEQREGGESSRKRVASKGTKRTAKPRRVA